MQTTVVHQLKKFKNVAIEATMICFHLEKNQKQYDDMSSSNQMKITISILEPSSLIF